MRQRGIRDENFIDTQYIACGLRFVHSAQTHVVYSLETCGVGKSNNLCSNIIIIIHICMNSSSETHYSIRGYYCYCYACVCMRRFGMYFWFCLDPFTCKCNSTAAALSTWFRLWTTRMSTYTRIRTNTFNRNKLSIMDCVPIQNES